ncbi:MAG: hypothetical protein Q8O19_00850 [Rectinemataceae bacterium]|nr:hypothetical protein [Rectinemataceae bacterium]
MRAVSWYSMHHNFRDVFEMFFHLVCEYTGFLQQLVTCPYVHGTLQLDNVVAPGSVIAFGSKPNLFMNSVGSGCVMLRAQMKARSVRASLLVEGKEPGGMKTCAVVNRAVFVEVLIGCRSFKG